MNVNLPTLREADLAQKKVLVRADLEWEGENSPREAATREIIKYLQDQKVQSIKVIGHKGRMEMPGIEIDNDVRRDSREKTNDESYARELAGDFEVYINESFAESHRVYTSVNALPKLMKREGKAVYAGLRFEKEIEMLSNVFTRMGRRVLVIGGAKAGDKAEMADKLAPKFDIVLRGGLLPGVSLRPDGLDIDDASIEVYKQEIAAADVIVVAGPMGEFENPQAEEGTREVFMAVVNTEAYKVAGGGSTEEAVAKMGTSTERNSLLVSL